LALPGCVIVKQSVAVISDVRGHVALMRCTKKCVKSKVIEQFQAISEEYLSKSFTNVSGKS
jgi:hypothetical protein